MQSLKVEKILLNDELEESFKEIGRMVSAETLLNYPDWKIPFTVHTYDSDKQLGGFIIHSNKTILILSSGLINTWCNYTTIEKELNLIVECLQQLCGILFGYEINIYLDHKKLVYIENNNE